jgi:predicted nucleic acid-binding protein
MKVAVQDANIIIDLIDCGIFELFFRLDLEIVTTSLLLAEISEPPQRKACQAVVRKKWLNVVEISTLDYLRLQRLNLPGLSVPDRSALELAEARRAYLLTGDGRLRKAAKSSDVDVRGILWVFDQLIGSGLLSKAEARARLAELKERNQRLPKAEIEKRLKAWDG